LRELLPEKHNADGTYWFPPAPRSACQAGEYVLLGDTHDPRYYKLLSQQNNYCQGTLTMAEKGGAFGPGKIAVVGSNDEDNFRLAIRDFSRKKITFA
jgi:hypothetical protein